MTSPGLVPFSVLGQSGQYLSAAGDAYRVLVTGDQSAGTFLAAEILVRPGGGPPPHMHEREDETFFVLEGEIQFTIDGKVIVAGEGSCVFAPRHVPHAYRNVSSRLVRVLVV